MKRSEMKMIERSANNRWPVTAEVRQNCIERLTKIIAESKSERSVIAATRALAAMEKSNASNEAAELREKIEHEAQLSRIAGVARQLGLVDSESEPDAA